MEPSLRAQSSGLPWWDQSSGNAVSLPPLRNAHVHRSPVTASNSAIGRQATSTNSFRLEL